MSLLDTSISGAKSFWCKDQMVECNWEGILDSVKFTHFTGVRSIPIFRISVMSWGEWVTTVVSNRQDQKVGIYLHSPTIQKWRKKMK
jgi:hypothetical protein